MLWHFISDAGIPDERLYPTWYNHVGIVPNSSV
jgi:hypothetical protein